MESIGMVTPGTGPSLWSRGRRFGNPTGQAGPTAGQIARWCLAFVAGRRRRSPARAAVPIAREVQVPAHDYGSVLWLGHATTLITIDGLRIITDPVFAGRVGPFARRNVPVVLAPTQLPRIDVVAISHNHYDHLDRASVLAIERQHAPRYLVPLGVEHYLRAWGVPADRIERLDWWQEARSVADQALRITFVPAQHWSRRSAFDRNRSLWGGYVFQAGAASVYVAGDSAYFDGFKEIGRRFPGLDLAVLPIGPYDPDWFTRHCHLNPEQAGQAFLDTAAARMMPMHWGTYKLGDEPLDEPMRRLERWRRRMGLSRDRVLAVPVGAHVALDTRDSDTGACDEAA